MIRGDLGRAYITGRPIVRDVAERFPKTLLLGGGGNGARGDRRDVHRRIERAAPAADRSRRIGAQLPRDLLSRCTGWV